MNGSIESFTFKRSNFERTNLKIDIILIEKLFFWSEFEETPFNKMLTFRCIQNRLQSCCQLLYFVISSNNSFTFLDISIYILIRSLIISINYLLLEMTMETN